MAKVQMSCVPVTAEVKGLILAIKQLDTDPKASTTKTMKEIVSHYVASKKLTLKPVTLAAPTPRTPAVVATAPVTAPTAPVTAPVAEVKAPTSHAPGVPSIKVDTTAPVAAKTEVKAEVKAPAAKGSVKAGSKTAVHA